MKKMFLMAAAGMLALSSLADDKVPALQVKSSNAVDPVNFELARIQKITFDGETMLIQNADGTEQFNMRDIEKMVFASVSGVEEIVDFDLGNDLAISIRHGELTARQEGQDLNLRIYDLNGRSIDTRSANSELNYSLNALSAGTYIIVVNDKAIKFIR